MKIGKLKQSFLIIRSLSVIPTPSILNTSKGFDLPPSGRAQPDKRITYKDWNSVQLSATPCGLAITFPVDFLITTSMKNHLT